MSSKSVEMQIAIPRTSEIGNVQNQLMQKPVYDQAALAAKTMQQKQRQLQQSTKVEEPPSSLVRDEQRESKKEQKQGKTKADAVTPGASSRSARTEHPYKGKHIDFSL